MDPIGLYCSFSSVKHFSNQTSRTLIVPSENFEIFDSINIKIPRDRETQIPGTQIPRFFDPSGQISSRPHTTDFPQMVV